MRGVESSIATTPDWRRVRDDAKYGHVVDFGRALPELRRRLEGDLAQRGLRRRKVVAAVLSLIDRTLLRVGNDEYARRNHSFGLTTLEDRHARVGKTRLSFRFRGKSGKVVSADIEDERMARIVRRCRELPGQRLFQYVTRDGKVVAVGSTDVNDYLRRATGKAFTAKDFRTWAGTVLAATALRELEKFDSRAQAKRNLVQAIERVARRLGNTPSICRKCYVHPLVVDSYLDGSLARALKRRTSRGPATSLHRMSPEEAAVLALLGARPGEGTGSRSGAS